MAPQVTFSWWSDPQLQKDREKFAQKAREEALRMAMSGVTVPGDFNETLHRKASPWSSSWA